MENKTLCFTGKRPKDLFGYNDRESYEKLRDNVADMIIYLYTQGYKKYITGGAQGFDQVCFDAVEKLKEIHPEVENIIFAPCHNQDSKWSEKGLFSKEEYRERLSKADKVVYVTEINYTPYCLNERNHAMVLNSDAVLSLFPDDTWSTIKKGSGTAECMNFALKKDIEMYQIRYNPDDILNSLTFTQIDKDRHRGIEKVRFLKEEEKDLFGIKDGIFCQQVNCQGVMGAGLAKAIYEKFPVVKEKFLENYNKNKGSQLGKVSVIPVANNGNLLVANIYGQEYYGNPYKTNKIYTDINKLINAITKVSIVAENTNKNIYIPVGIGCGYGGEKWDRVNSKIREIVNENKLNNVYLINTNTLEVEKVTPKKDMDLSLDDIDIEK